MSSVEVVVQFANCPVNAVSFFVEVTVFLSVSVSVRLKSRTGLVVLSGILCDMTQPRPTGDASTATCSGSVGL